MKDGRILKKRLHDDGFGKKTLSEYGMQYDFKEKRYETTYTSDGLFQQYTDLSGKTYNNLS